MLSYILITAAAIFLMGTAVLVHGLMTSVEGYQDEFGFHEGKEPQSRSSHRKSGVVKIRSSAKRRAPKSRELEFAS
jgi:hypothetical protein